MSGDELRDYGIAAAKAGRKDEARELLTQATQVNPRDIQAWLFLASVTDDKKARLLALRHVLEIDPKNALGLSAVKALGVDPAKLIATSTPPPPAAPPVLPAAQTPAPDSPPVSGIRSLSVKPPPRQPAPEPIDDLFGGEFAALESPKSSSPTQSDLDALFGDESTPAAPAAPSGPKKLPSLSDRPRATEENPALTDTGRQRALTDTGRQRAVVDPNTPGVPIPDADFVAKAIKDVDYLAETLLGQSPNLNTDWVKKTKGRAGESDIWRLRAQIWGAIVAFVLTLVIISVILVSTPEVQRVVFNQQTRTPSRTPTNTATFTPGFTPTPTATLDSTQFPTYTPSPTLPLTLSPVGRPNVTPRPTQRYLPVPLDGGLSGAVSLLDRGAVNEALPTLDAEYNIVRSGNFRPNAYYFDGIALARAGKFSEALNVLNEGESRLENDTTSSDRPRFKALIDLGFAEYELLRALDFQGRGEAGNAAAAFEAARVRAQTALDFDPRYAQGYLIIARAYKAERKWEDGLLALDKAREMMDRTPEFGINMDFVIERGELHWLRALALQESGGLAAARADYEAAAYQGFYGVYLNPYDRRAHEMRINAAIALEIPGDAVLANDTYRFYYPDDPRALRLLGDARIAEGNTDLALGSYAAALDADTRDEDGVLGAESANILAERAQVYFGEGEFALALADLNTALGILPERQDLQAQRMDVAFAAGDFETALADSRALFNSRVLPNDVFKLMEARILVITSDGAEPAERRAALQEADTALDFVGGNLPAHLREAYGEVRAGVLLERGFPADAVEAASESLVLVDSPAIRFIRGRAWEAQFRLDNAARDYKRVLDDTVDVNEDLALKAQAALEQVSIFSTATSTAVTATAVAGNTATAQANRTATQAARATATANAAATDISGTTTAEANLAATATAEAQLALSATLTPTRTPTMTRTPTPRPTDTGAGDED